MSRSYSASTRNRLWRLVRSIARPDLQRNVGAENSVGRGGPGRACRSVFTSDLAVAHQGTRRSIRPDTCLHSFSN
jgi:hypothetical protein